MYSIIDLEKENVEKNKYKNPVNSIIDVDEVDEKSFMKTEINNEQEQNEIGNKLRIFNKFQRKQKISDNIPDSFYSIPESEPSIEGFQYFMIDLAYNSYLDNRIKPKVIELIEKWPITSLAEIPLELMQYHKLFYAVPSGCFREKNKKDIIKNCVFKNSKYGLGKEIGFWNLLTKLIKLVSSLNRFGVDKSIKLEENIIQQFEKIYDKYLKEYLQVPFVLKECDPELRAENWTMTFDEEKAFLLVHKAKQVSYSTKIKKKSN